MRSQLIEAKMFWSDTVELLSWNWPETKDGLKTEVVHSRGVMEVRREKG